MANTKNAKKAARKAVKRRLYNRYHAKTTRNAVKAILNENDINTQKEKLSSVISLVDKLAKRNIIHKNKASNIKSRLMKRILKAA